MAKKEDKEKNTNKYPRNDWLVLAHQSLICTDDYLKEKYKRHFPETVEEFILFLPKLMHHLFKTISPMKDPEKGNEGDDLEKYKVKLEQ